MARGEPAESKPRRRALGETTNLRRQTDSLASTVELLQQLLAEQRQTNELLRQLLERPAPPT